MSVNLTDNSPAVKEALQRAAQAFLHEAAGELVSETRKNSRVDTGQTKNSYEYRIEESSTEQKAVIGSPLENAVWEEFGTGEYALGGNGRKTPWVYTDRHGEKHVTKGKTPNQPMKRAYDALKEPIKQQMQEKFGPL